MKNLLKWLVCILFVISTGSVRGLCIRRLLQTAQVPSPLRGTAGIHNTLLREMGAPSPHMVSNSPVSHFLPLGPSFLKLAANLAMTTPALSKLNSWTPPIVRSVIKCIHPAELFLLLVFQLSYSRALKFAHSMQTKIWNVTKFGAPNEWNSSILGFVHERSHLLSKLITFNYGAKLLCTMLARLGFNVRADFPSLLSRISYALFLAQFADMFKAQFLRSFFPKVGESKRQSYMVNKSASVIIWTVGGLVACEMVSSYLHVPLSSTLAFGGVGGLAVGLSLRDIAANFMGGMMLLFNEPFTPGDMVTFKSGKTEIVGRVERVGWGQTRIRGRDTRPTYVPNSHFAQAAVTNMERITHRKFETIVPIRFEDYSVIAEVVARIKERLRTVPKLDVLSMPFRVSFVKVGAYSLEVEITCYFATKSIDEFLSLQQMANMEVIAAIQDCGASLALPTSLMQIDSTTSFISTSTTYAGRSSASALHHGAVVRTSPTTTGSARNSNSNSNRSSGVGVGAEEDDEDYEEETDSGGGTDDTESGTGKGTGRRDTRGTSSSCSSSDLAEEMELAEALQSLPRGVTMQDDAEDDRLLGEHLPLGSAEAAAAAVVAAGLNGDRVSTVVGQGVNEARSAPTIIPTDSSARGARGAWDSAPMKNRQQQVEAQADFSFDVRTFGNPALSPHPQQSQSFVAAVDADDIDVDDDTVSAATVTASAVPAVAVAATVEYVNDDIWHESLRSAGIRTDTKKYFVEAVAAAATPTATTTAGSGGDVERHQQGHQHIERISSPEASPQRPTSVFWEQDSSNTDAIQIVDSSKRDELQ